nr:hypothetical protein BaRGS_017250 [Batillaria attramentaria]
MKHFWSDKGALGIVQTNLVPILVQKLLSELDEIKKLILDTLHFCMRVDTEKALKADAMTAFTELLSHKNSGIRAKAARDIMDLSVPLDGKNKAVECGSVPPLIELLKDPLSDVRANAAGAIMTITITTKGKYTAIDAGAIAPLVDLVQDATSEVRLNALKPDKRAGYFAGLFVMERKFAKFFHHLVHELIPDNGEREQLFDALRLYQTPLIALRHQMEYSYLAPAVPGVGDEIVRVNGFTIAEAIHEDVLNLIKTRDEIILKVTHIGMLPIKEQASQTVTWQYVEDMDSKVALAEVLEDKQVKKAKPVELKIFIDCTGYDSIGCGIVSGPRHYPGIFVEKVRPGSLAEEGGLEVGDQLVEVNETSFLNIGHKEVGGRRARVMQLRVVGKSVVRNGEAFNDLGERLDIEREHHRPEDGPLGDAEL